MHAGAFKLQENEELDSEPLIMRSGCVPAVRAGFIPLHIMTVLAAQLCVCRRCGSDKCLEITAKTEVESGLHLYGEKIG